MHLVMLHLGSKELRKLGYATNGFCTFGILVTFNIEIEMHGRVSLLDYILDWTQNLTTKSPVTTTCFVSPQSSKAVPLAATAIFHWGIWTFILHRETCLL